MRLFRITASDCLSDRATLSGSLLRDGDQVLDVGYSSDISTRFAEHVVCDVIRIGVENFALDDIRGLQQTIARCRPLVLLDVNHWQLDQCQRTPLPEFLSYLRGIFPLLYAVDETCLCDLHDVDGACLAMYRHIVSEQRYPLMVGAFDGGRLASAVA